MSQTQRRYPKEALVERGNAIFEKDIRPKLKHAGQREFVAIDIETGAYETDSDELVACHRLRARFSDAQIFVRRVGSPYARRFGGHRTKAK
jgi:hypothetical protein